jgi:predicted DNA-binding transcriptional regulator YafY
MKGRNSQVLRIYRLLSILEGAPHGLTAVDLESRLHERGFEVGKRTIYRDLEALKAAGFPLEEKGKSDENGTRWTLERNAKVNHYLVLNSRELMALYMARSMLAPLRETPFFQDLSSTFDKIADKIGAKAQAFMNEMGDELHFEPGPLWGLGLKPDIIDTLRAAITEGQSLAVVYNSVNSGTSSARNLGPHYLYFAKGSLYLVAEDLGDSVVKIFSVPRMESATMLDQSYTGKVLDPEEFFAGSFGVYRGGASETVRVAFEPAVASYVRERQWHASQKIINKDNGRIEVQFDVASTPELVQWILGFGANAKVLSPGVLAETVRAESAKTAALYVSQESPKKVG